MTSGSKWVTMADVARTAGVSKITVSRVIRTPEKVKHETRDRVRAAIRTLGYVLDEAAGALATGRSHTVAALISALDNAAFSSTIDSLTRELREGHHELLIASTGDSAGTEANLVRATMSRHPAGVVLSGSDHADETRTLLDRSRVTTVEIWELPEDPIDNAVGFSNAKIGHAITRFLFDMGRRHIAYIGNTAVQRGRLRRNGVVAAAAMLGLPEIPEIPVGVSSMTRVDQGAYCMKWLLSNCPGVDAVFCMNDWMALGAINEIQRQGKAVPADIAVAGVGDTDFSRERGLGITSVRVPGGEIGRMAARLILERGDSDSDDHTVIDLGFDIVRRSTA